MAKKRGGGKKSTVKKRSAPARRPAKKEFAKSKPAVKASPRAKAGRRSWLSADGDTPMIDQYARQLGTFIDAMADGIIDETEMADQESRLVALMREVEPVLDDKQHESVTRLLCELTAYDIMQMLKTLHEQRPRSRFQG